MTHPLLSGLAASPDIFIHQIDAASDRGLIIRLSAEQLRKASFLDERILGQGVEGGWAKWPEIESSARTAPPANVNFIFHIGHCGSTLISRLVEDAAGVRTLRELLAVRQFAMIAAEIPGGLSLWTEAEFRERLDLYLRTASSGAKTVIKATSWCGDLVNWTTGAALFCYLKPHSYIASMLGGANNPIDLRLNAALRLKRLRLITNDRICGISELSPGELAAMSWATETATIVPASGANRILAIEFDEFLSSPVDGLSAALRHLSLPSEESHINATLKGPLMRTYSKDASFSYSPDDRRALLAEYRSWHAEEIARGIAWLETKGKSLPGIAAALQKFS